MPASPYSSAEALSAASRSAELIGLALAAEEERSIRLGERHQRLERPEVAQARNQQACRLGHWLSSHQGSHGRHHTMARWRCKRVGGGSERTFPSSLPPLHAPWAISRPRVAALTVSSSRPEAGPAAQRRARRRLDMLTLPPHAAVARGAGPGTRARSERRRRRRCCGLQPCAGAGADRSRASVRAGSSRGAPRSRARRRAALSRGNRRATRLGRWRPCRWHASWSRGRSRRWRRRSPRRDASSSRRWRHIPGMCCSPSWRRSCSSKKIAPTRPRRSWSPRARPARRASSTWRWRAPRIVSASRWRRVGAATRQRLPSSALAISTTAGRRRTPTWAPVAAARPSTPGARAVSPSACARSAACARQFQPRNPLARARRPGRRSTCLHRRDGGRPTPPRRSRRAGTGAGRAQAGGARHRASRGGAAARPHHSRSAS